MATLTTRSATALYISAILGPGLLLTPAIATEIAGPASVIAWGALLLLSIPLAATFAALGVRYPVAGGTAAYAKAAFGSAAGRATGWLFLTGVVIGAPVVAYAGAGYVGDVAGVGSAGVAAIGLAVVALVIALVARGIAATARVQLALTTVLALTISIAIAFALPESTASNWTPFAPEGWVAVGGAASVLMFSFIGWEAVSHMAGELPDPRRQLPRAIATALVVIAVLYAGLAIATVGVLGSTPSPVAIADLMATGFGETGRRATVAIALLLTIGTMTTFATGALKLSGTLVPRIRPSRRLAFLGIVSALALAGLGAGVLGASGLTHASSACFVSVYVFATAAGVRMLRGWTRAAASVSAVASAVLVAFAGPYLAIPALVAAIAAFGPSLARRARRGGALGECPAPTH